MAIVPTARLGLNTWTAGTDPFTRAQRNADAATLDAEVAIYGQGTFAARPAGHIEGRFYLVDDAGDVDHDGELYYDTGAQWRLINDAPDLSGYATTAALNAGLAGKLDVAAQAADSAQLQGHNAAYFATAAALAGKLDVAAKAADSDLLDGIDSTGFARSTVDVNSPRRYTRDFLLMGG